MTRKRDKTRRRKINEWRGEFKEEEDTEQSDGEEGISEMWKERECYRIRGKRNDDNKPEEERAERVVQTERKEEKMREK
ncbi:hypothetical protein NDU88_003702 [Pleurodeles waltl]|uniref:Uncharacterized protein n=1 Tax=Pleurodeles waltl TaxID=8319 RepID=A0AAV7QCF9_PLEWA|nr:hypothetical protein NDU88_003702 [Pleurodeles waltl]